VINKDLIKDFLIEEFDFPSEEQILGACEIELRVDKQTKSSLNLSFGSGRMNKTGRYQRRPWLEVELSASASEINNEFYPKSELISPNRKTKKGSFKAYLKYLNNYYCLEMKVHADNGKNISSRSGGRAALGLIIKGKLIEKKCLNFGDLITLETLKNYGRNTIEFHKLSSENYILKF